MSGRKPTDAPPVATSERKPTPASKRKPGAPKRNQNSAIGYENLTPAKREKARRQRALDSKRSSAVVNAILREYDVAKSPSAREAAWWHRELRVVVQRLVRAAQRVPTTRKGGTPAQEINALVDRCSSGIATLERLLRVCRESSPKRTEAKADVERRVLLDDGTLVPPEVFGLGGEPAA